MKANEFVKNHGWEYTRGIIIACESGFLPKNQNYDDLKRLVESHELVESFKCKQYSGLSNAKDHLITLAHIEDHAELDRLGRAIADVESCQ